MHQKDQHWQSQHCEGYQEPPATRLDLVESKAIFRSWLLGMWNLHTWHYGQQKGQGSPGLRNDEPTPVTTTWSLFGFCIYMWPGDELQVAFLEGPALRPIPNAVVLPTQQPYEVQSSNHPPEISDQHTIAWDVALQTKALPWCVHGHLDEVYSWWISVHNPTRQPKWTNKRSTKLDTTCLKKVWWPSNLQSSARILGNESDPCPITCFTDGSSGSYGGPCHDITKAFVGGSQAALKWRTKDRCHMGLTHCDHIWRNLRNDVTLIPNNPLGLQTPIDQRDSGRELGPGTLASPIRKLPKVSSITKLDQNLSQKDEQKSTVPHIVRLAERRTWGSLILKLLRLPICHSWRDLFERIASSLDIWSSSMDFICLPCKSIWADICACNCWTCAALWEWWSWTASSRDCWGPARCAICCSRNVDSFILIVSLHWCCW